jgi:hypothetical protein
VCHQQKTVIYNEQQKEIMMNTIKQAGDSTSCGGLKKKGKYVNLIY